MDSRPTDLPRLLRLAIHPRGQLIIAIASLCTILLFNSFFYVYRPYDGMGVYQEAPLGEVYEVIPSGPAEQAGIQVGDQIIAIDGRPIDPQVAEPRYRPGLNSGDSVTYHLSRGNEQVVVSLEIGDYLTNLSLLGTYLGVQFLSIGLWIIGLVLALFVPADDLRARLLSLGFVTAALTAAVGGASGWNSFWGANTIQKVLLSLLAPLIVTAHLTFPKIRFTQYRKTIIHGLFALAGMLSVLTIIEDWGVRPRGLQWVIPFGLSLRDIIFIYFMLAWVFAVLLLIFNRVRSSEPEIRRQTGIIIWGMVLGIGPFFVLTLLPYILFGDEYLPGSTTILFLILLPLAYAYVIFQRKLLKVDFFFNRLVVWFTLILLILIASILVFGVLVVAFDLPAQLPIYGGVVAALIALPFSTLSKTVQDSVDRILYGSHYDYWTVTSSMSRQLAQTLDRNRLINLLTDQLSQQMGIYQTELLLTDGGLLISEKTTDQLPALSLDNNLCRELRHSHIPMRASQAWNLLSPGEKTDWEHYAWVQVFAPLVFKDELQGILILGQRVTGDVYSDQDLSIIATVAEQGALALVNVILFEKQRRLARQLVRSAEEERKRLASDLHDTVLQELFFIKQGLHQNPGNPELVDYLEESIQNLRQSIKLHRPPLLDKGLTLALQGLVEDMRKLANSKTTILWSTNIEESPGLNDEQATVIFRIAQEALNNAVKHAKASLVEVNLEQCHEQITHLKVSDNGSGLPWLQPDGNLDHAHFGLVLMQERAAMIDARLLINSLPGEGTTIELEVAA